MTSTLFIIGSPFQGLCLLEAVNHFNITEYDVFVLDSDYGNSTAQTKALLTDKGVSFSTYKVHHAINDLLPFVMKKHKRYKNIFIGNYYNPTDEAIAAFYGKLHYQLFFLDDGLQALSLFSEKPRNRYGGSRKWEYWFKIYFAIGNLKGRKKPIFFTIFDVKSDKFIIIKNTFQLLKSQTELQMSGCYIIGTNSSIVSFRDYRYLDLLESLLYHLRCKYPNEKILYCPHRRDGNNDNIYKWCSAHNVEWFNTRVSVEYDFVMNGINPHLVIGFTSNALYTLKKIFSESEIQTVFYHCNPPKSDDEINTIRQRMNEKGIKTMYLDSL